MSEENNSLFQRLKALVSTVSGGNQTAFAASIGLTQSTFSGYFNENGVARIKLPTIKRIVEAHNVNPIWLLTGEGPMFRGEEQMPTPSSPAYEIKQLGRNGAIRRAEVVRGTGEIDLGYLIDVHAEAGAGPARERWEPEPIATVCIPPEYARPGLFGLRIRGDSMEPLIRRGAFVGVDSEDRVYTSGDIYAIYMPYEGLTVKRLFHDPAVGEYVLRSVNPDHPDMRLPISQSDQLIVGRVVWVLQRF